MKNNKHIELATDALEIMDRLFYDGRPDRQAALKEAYQRGDVAEKIYNMRRETGFTQKELAQIVGTSASVISRLEGANYRKHSLWMLRRIATALGRSVEVNFPKIAQSNNQEPPSSPKEDAQMNRASEFQKSLPALMNTPIKAPTGDLPMAA